MGCGVVDVQDGRPVVSFHRDPVASAATAIRRELRAELAAWGLGHDAVDDALLVVEELVSNGVDHARTSVQLVVHLDADVLHVAVRDWCPVLVRVQELDLGRLRGRGLLMVDDISTRWGCDLDATGKTVWAELPV